MPIWIGFLRAVNVGKRQVRMQTLRELLEDNGLRGRRDPHPSGNLKVRSRDAQRRQGRGRSCARLISDAFGFDVPVVVRTPAQLRALADEADALESPIAADAGRYVTFMTGDLDPAGVEALHAWDVETEAARVVGNDIVLFLAAGVQGAKLTNARIEKLTGAVGTARNITVVRALADKWGGDWTPGGDRTVGHVRSGAGAPDELEADDGAGRRDVERLDAGGHRDRHPRVDEVGHVGREAGRLAAEHEGDRLGQVGGEEVVIAVGIEPDDVEAVLPSAAATASPAVNALRIGARKATPAEALTTSGSIEATPRRGTTMPSSPAAVAVRRIMPTLAGVVSPSSTSTVRRSPVGVERRLERAHARRHDVGEDALVLPAVARELLDPLGAGDLHVEPATAGRRPDLADALAPGALGDDDLVDDEGRRRGAPRARGCDRRR